MKKFLNPFVYYSGGVTLTIGLLGMVAMVGVAGATDQTFRGLISYGIGERVYWQLAGQLFAGWLLFSGILYGAARLFSASHVRWVDIAGNQALAKLSGLSLLLFACLYSPQQLLHDTEAIQQMDLSQLQNWTPPIGMLLAGGWGICVLVWFFAWSWMGFSIAANMHGKKAVGIYIGCYLLAEGLIFGCDLLAKALTSGCPPLVEGLASVCTSLLQ